MKTKQTTIAKEWADELDDLFGIAYDDFPNGVIGITPTVEEIKAFISKVEVQTRATTLDEFLVEYKKRDVGGMPEAGDYSDGWNDGRKAAYERVVNSLNELRQAINSLKQV